MTKMLIIRLAVRKRSFPALAYEALTSLVLLSTVVRGVLEAENGNNARTRTMPETGGLDNPYRYWYIHSCLSFRPQLLDEQRLLIVMSGLSLYASLHNLGAVSPDPVGECPALVLQLHVLVEINAVLCDDGNRVLVHTPSISVEENLHALLDLLYCLFPCDVFYSGLIW